MQLDMTKGPIFPLLIRFMIPVWIGNIFQQVYNMVDSMIVGKYVGATALAAVGSTGNLMFLMTGFSLGFAAGFSIVTSQAFGAGNRDQVRRSVANGVLLSVLTVAVLTVFNLLILDTLLRWMNTPEDILPEARTYIRIIAAGLFANTFYNLFGSFLRAVGNSRAPLFFVIFSACLNVVLDLLFIRTFHMGVAGAAWATVLSQAVSAVLCLLYTLLRVKILIPHREDWRLSRDISKEQLRLGVPMALQFAVTASGMAIMQSAINLFGSTAVASITAASKLQYLLMQGVMAMGIAIGTWSGQNYGAGDLSRVRAGVRTAVLFEFCYSLFAAAMMLLVFPHLLFLFFEDGTDMAPVLEMAGTYYRVCSLFYLPLSFILIFRNGMQGCGHGFIPLLSGVIELLSRCGMAFASMKTHSFTLAVACDPAAWLIAGIYCLCAWFFVMKRYHGQRFGRPA